MAIDIYAAISVEQQQAMVPIQGESTAVFNIPGVHTSNLIEIRGLTYSIENNSSLGSASSGAGADKATTGILTLTKPLDSTSHQLIQALVSGQSINVVLVYAKSIGGKLQAFSTLTLTKAFFKSYTQSAINGNDAPIETFGIEYGGFAISYIPNDVSGKLLQPVEMQWSTITNSSKLAVPA